ncbi:caltractin [Plakobranchus ocellatus]|uniref:Caltractin n=1 Tax=Plakobranchus ocellatus TaxID=259542 RepID=A0AAV4BGI0_9GAST|nr:caltractin [Plakobranchus ocellatus]
MKEETGLTQTRGKGLGSVGVKWWSKTVGKEKRVTIINEVQQSQQGLWTSFESALQRSITWNEIWHMAPLKIGFLIQTVHDQPSKANLVRWGMKNDPTCPMCRSRQAIEHVLSSRKVALSQGRYTGRHKSVKKNLPWQCDAYELLVQPKARTQYPHQKVEPNPSVEVLLA